MFFHGIVPETQGKDEKMEPILLAPAGSFESLEAALQNGAGAVYFGAGRLNMRARAAVNFTPDDLPEIVRRCHAKQAKAWLTLNTILYDGEVDEVRELCRQARTAGIDAVIAMDPAVIGAAAETGLPVHLSVQANISNMESVRFYSRCADAVVLARELTLEQIARICRGIREQEIRGPSGELVKVEVFIHGALCVAISGRCYMSLAEFNSSANRGGCFQSCRRKYLVRDADNGMEFTIDNQYVMSPKDLCTIECLDAILDSGVSILKIEGRGRSADYVARTVSIYRKAVDLWLSGKRPSPEQRAEWKRALAEVFNRGFWEGGYYLGRKPGEWAGCGDNRATMKKCFLGTVVNYYPKAKAAEVRLSAESLHNGTHLLVTGNTTGAVEVEADGLRVDDVPVPCAEKGSFATFPCETKLRPGDKVYRLVPVTC